MHALCRRCNQGRLSHPTATTPPLPLLPSPPPPPPPKVGAASELGVKETYSGYGAEQGKAGLREKIASKLYNDKIKVGATAPPFHCPLPQNHGPPLRHFATLPACHSTTPPAHYPGTTVVTPLRHHAIAPPCHQPTTPPFKPEEVFVSDGAKCDIARLQMMFG